LTAPAALEYYTLSLHDALPIYLLQVDGEYNVIRNNVFDNDWSELLGSGKGGRNLSLMGLYNVFENNVVRNAMASTDRAGNAGMRSEEHTSELQSRENLVCRLLL